MILIIRWTVAREERSLLVASAIRKRIVTGEFVPGSQLPTWDVLGNEYSVGRNTLVRAISQLKQQRFIYSSSTRGTFVVDHPPHLHNYALLFRDNPGERDWSQFWWALTNQAAAIQGREGCQITSLYNVRNEANNEAHIKLLEDVATDQYAGLIFVSTPETISLPCLKIESLPKVGICAQTPFADLPNVYIDRASFLRKAIRWLAEQGRRNIAIIAHYNEPYLQQFPLELRRCGLKYRQHWALPAAGTQPSTAEPILRLLFAETQSEKPDGLIIANDNMVDASLAAMMACGRRVPEETRIVAHCNWPINGANVLPTNRLGFDVRQILRECLKIISQWRAGRKAPPSVMVPALFEYELNESAVQN